MVRRIGSIAIWLLLLCISGGLVHRVLGPLPAHGLSAGLWFAGTATFTVLITTVAYTFLVDGPDAISGLWRPPKRR